MEQHLGRDDRRLIGVCIAITIASLAVGGHFFYQAFPEATIDFRITRDEARVRAESFLHQRGLEVGEYRHSAIFSFDNSAKTFLERELGMEGTAAVIGNPVRLWRWSNRWVRELEKEEFRVQYTTEGELVGFQHLVEEEAPGTSLDQAAARNLAEQFLSLAADRDPTDLEFVEGRTERRPNRTDHSFTWKLRDFELHEATYRYQVDIHGDLPGAYREYLKIPEEWTRQYQELRSRNEATGLVAGSLMLLTWLAMLVFLGLSIRGQDVRWRTALTFGGVAFVLTALSQLNMLPVAEFGFDTTDTYGSFMSDQIVSSLLAGLGAGVLITFLVAAGEPVYRRHYGDHISLTELFLPDGIRTKRFLLGTVIGLAATAGFMAYVTVFYLVAGKLGAWAPADIPYREMVNTYIPWVVVLLIGFLPAVSEELTSRAFSIPFFQRYLKRRWAAVLVSALIWGFAHATYPQQPFYIRGIEVTIAGLAFGYIMIRWGLLPVLVCHYTIDALWTAMILLRSSNSYFVVSAALSVGIMLLPLLVSVAFHVRHRFFIDPTSLLNREDAPPPPRQVTRLVPDLSPESRLLELESDMVARYVPLSGRRLAAGAVVVLAALAVYFVEADTPVAPPQFTFTPVQAERLATDHLTGLGVEVESYEVVTSYRMNWDARAAQYRLEHGGLEAVGLTGEAGIVPHLWRVRFYQPRQKEEYHVYIDPAEGSVYTVSHLIEEEAPGADLPEDEARRLAEGQLRAYGLDPALFELKNSTSEKMKARRDYRFEYEAREGDRRNVEESYFRCTVEIAGDQPTGLRRHIKLPETWLREREESTFARSALGWILGLAGVALFLHLCWLLVRLLRESTVAWRLPLYAGLSVVGLALLGFLNDLPTVFASYDTAHTTTVFVIMRLTGVMLLFLLGGAAAALAVALAAGLFPDVAGQARPTTRMPVVRDALAVALMVWVGGLAMERLSLLLAAWLPAYASAPAPPGLPGVDTLLPFWTGLSGALGAALSLPIAAAITVHYAARVLGRTSYVVVALLVLGISISGSGAHSAGEFYLSLAEFALQAGVAAAVIGLYLRDNLLAYVLVAFVPRALDGALDLLAQPSTFYQANGAVLAIMAAAAVAAIALRAWRGDLNHPEPTLS